MSYDLGWNLSDAPVICPLCLQIHDRCRFTAGSLYCARQDCQNPHHRQPARLKGPAMTARPEVVAMLTDFDVERTSSGQRFVHRDGRPFTAQETELIGTATEEDMRAAASELAATPDRLTEVLMPYIRKVAEGFGDGEPPRRHPDPPA